MTASEMNIAPSSESAATTQRHIVLIPGFMCDASLWQEVLGGLQQLGTVSFADLNQGTDIDAMAERIIASLPQSCVLIGFSLGGYVARRIAAKAPQRVSQLVLLNTSARATSAEEIARNQQQIKMLKVFPYKGQTVTALKRALHPARNDNQVLLRHLQTMSLTLGADIFMQQLSIIRQDGHADCAQIFCPVLVVASREDQIRRLQEAEDIFAALPDPTFRIIEDCGHMSPLEQPQILMEYLREFLSQTN